MRERSLGMSTDRFWLAFFASFFLTMNVLLDGMTTESRRQRCPYETASESMGSDEVVEPGVARRRTNEQVEKSSNRPSLRSSRSSSARRRFLETLEAGCAGLKQSTHREPMSLAEAQRSRVANGGGGRPTASSFPFADRD